jgi:hypothetical protein
LFDVSEFYSLGLNITAHTNSENSKSFIYVINDEDNNKTYLYEYEELGLFIEKNNLFSYSNLFANISLSFSKDGGAYPLKSEENFFSNQFYKIGIAYKIY